MPIIQMTRREDVIPKFPDLGKIRKGGPKTEANRPGPDLSYWRFTSERPEVQAAFAVAYPGQPKLIEAYLPFPSMEENWQTWCEEYDAGGLRHRCDGVTMYRWRKNDGAYQDGEQPCPFNGHPELRTKARPGCKQVGRLYLIIPQLIRAGFVGFVTMETHSINDLVSITACLMDAERKAGKLSGILFSVLRVPQTISTPAWKEEDKAAGKRARVSKSLVKIVPAADWVMAQLDHQHAEQMSLAAGQVLQLPAGNGIDDEDELDDEWEDVERPSLPDAVDAEWASIPTATDERTADTIIAGLRAAAANNTQAPTADDLKKLRANIANLVGRDANRRKAHHLLQTVYGKASTNDLTQGECQALSGLIDSRKQLVDGVEVWLPSGQAVDDWKLILTVYPYPEVEAATNA